VRRRGEESRQRALCVFELAILTFVVGAAIAVPMMPARAAQTWTVQMTEYQFTDKFLTISVGDSVVWHNSGSFSHSTTANGTDPATWDHTVSPGTSSPAVPFTIPGTYNYICKFHIGDNMWGRITVQTVVPEFSGSFVVVAGMLAMAIGLVVAGRRTK
jgi:plastocyanin